jgi:hypothetical protein
MAAPKAGGYFMGRATSRPARGFTSKTSKPMSDNPKDSPAKEARERKAGKKT